MYGIPFDARRVVKFNPIDKSLTFVGQDLGDGRSNRWEKGVLANNGCIYCAPDECEQILKIDTTNGTTTVLDVQVPERHTTNERWISGALALDGCIYFMPCNAHRILKIDPKNDSVCCVGDDFGGGKYKYSGTVAGSDGYLYGIPDGSTLIIRFDPISYTTSILGDEADNIFKCYGSAFGRDGCIYSFSYTNYKVLQIDVVNHTYSLVGKEVVNIPDSYWGDGILGNDGCIYWPPNHAERTMKFDVETQTISLVGNDFGSDAYKWYSGAVASDGAIYVLPFCTEQILRIDPFLEFVTKLKADMEEHPEVLGFLSETNDFGKNLYKDAITKYGKEKAVEVINKHIPASIELEGKEMEAFMVAASCEDSSLDVIYHLLTRDVGQSSLANWSIASPRSSFHK